MSKTKNKILWGGIAIGVFIALPVIVYAIFNWVYTDRVDERIAAIKAKGQPVTIADLASKADSPADDAAKILRGIRSDINAVASELAPLQEDNRLYRGSLSDTDQEMIRAALAAHPDLIPTLTHAARASEYSVMIGNMPSAAAFIARQPRVQILRSIARILSARAMLLNAEEKPDEALDTCITLLRLCRHFDQEPALISHLVAIACRIQAITCANVILREDGVSQAARENLEAELARHDLSAAYQDALVEERAVGIAHFRQILNQIGYSPARVMFLKDMADYLDLVGAQIETAETPYYIASEEPIEIEDFGTLSSLSAPALESAREATARSVAKLRCLRILNAITSQAIDNENVSLDDLELPSDVLIDPFTGDQLLLKQTDDGWIIYSVGADGQDDGGDLTKARDVGVGPAEGETAAISVD